MDKAKPYWREAGRGAGVVCFHSNASVSGQWRGLMERLEDRFRVLAPDSYGAGKSPQWPSDREITLADEVALVEPVLSAAGAPVVLVGHSYGGAIAMRIAVQAPERVRALVLYEPTLFSLIEREGPSPNDADGIRDTVERAAAALDNGDRNEAARSFIDYWMGPDSWDNMPVERRPAIANAVVNVRRWRHALFTEPTPLEAFARLDMPVLVMTGAKSTLSAHGVSRRLLGVLPRATHVEFADLGHMGPVTHASIVDQAIDAFLTDVAARS